jgi:hypothetical protein
LQRARSYGLDGAFPVLLQPQLLERYEWVSSRWHEFLHLPSMVAAADTRAGWAGIDDCERGPSAAAAQNVHPSELAPTIPKTHIVAPSKSKKRRRRVTLPFGFGPASNHTGCERPARPEQGAAQSKRTRLADPSPPPTRPVSARADEPTHTPTMECSTFR